MKIEIKKLWRGRSGSDKTYFHPRATLLKEKTLFMTLQEISGSDYFHPVKFSFSHDGGRSWSNPELIPDFGRNDIGDGIENGVCDVVPDLHPQTEKVLAIGHNVYYKGGRLFDSLGDFRKENISKPLRRRIVYNIMDENGRWLDKRQKLEFEELDACSMFSCNCSQKVILPDGKIIIPFRFAFWGRRDQLASSLLCEFDGEKITAVKKGNNLEHPIGRGFLEPSIVKFQEKYWMTIRAEDNHGYVACSENGLDWGEAIQWRWDYGEEILMSTTQQHWLVQKGELYLVYTRKSEENINVMRWRSPLFIAKVDTIQGLLIKETEQVVFPLVGDGVNDPDNVPLMGNFHVTELSEEESIITVGEMTPRKGYKGDSLLAFVRA